MFDEILAFWFGPAPGEVRAEWFRKDDAFDAQIRARFRVMIDDALQGEYADWTHSARGSLARVLLLDQFTRNVFRDTPRAFAGDALALATAQAALDQAFDQALSSVERWFLYMPFEHAESAAAQERSLSLFGQLASTAGFDAPLEWAQKHAAIIARFGRYPHRNEVLGRASTPDEIAFLNEAGSRF